MLPIHDLCTAFCVLLCFVFYEKIIINNVAFRPRRVVYAVVFALDVAAALRQINRKMAKRYRQCFMQDQNVACHDLGIVSFERAVGCFGKPQLERATRFQMPQLERATRFPMSQLERATRFPNVPSRARDSLLNCQFKVCVFDCFCHSMPFICLNITSIYYIN